MPVRSSPRSGWRREFHEGRAASSACDRLCAIGKAGAGGIARSGAAGARRDAVRDEVRDAAARLAGAHSVGGALEPIDAQEGRGPHRRTSSQA